MRGLPLFLISSFLAATLSACASAPRSPVLAIERTPAALPNAECGDLFSEIKTRELVPGTEMLKNVKHKLLIERKFLKLLSRESIRWSELEKLADEIQSLAETPWYPTSVGEWIWIPGWLPGWLRSFAEHTQENFRKLALATPSKMLFGDTQQEMEKTANRIELMNRFTQELDAQGIPIRGFFWELRELVHKDPERVDPIIFHLAAKIGRLLPFANRFLRINSEEWIGSSPFLESEKNQIKLMDQSVQLLKRMYYLSSLWIVLSHYKTLTRYALFSITALQLATVTPDQIREYRSHQSREQIEQQVLTGWISAQEAWLKRPLDGRPEDQAWLQERKLELQSYSDSDLRE